MGQATASFSTATYPYVDPLVCDDDLVTRAGILLAGGKSLRGQLLEFASGKWKPAATTAMGILAEDCDSTAGDASCIVYVGGMFMASGIIWGAMAHDVATEQLRDVGIQIQSVVSSVGTMVKGVPLPSEEVRVDDTAITKDPHPKEILTDHGPIPATPQPGEAPGDEWAKLEPHPAPLRVQPGQTEPPPEPKDKGGKTHHTQPPPKDSGSSTKK